MILTEIKQNIGYIILNRLDKKNALNHDMVQMLKEAFVLFEKNDRIRVVVLKSNSDVYSAGADLEYLKSLQQNTFNENLADSNHLKELYEMIYKYPKIVISQVEGHAIAGGCGLATVADFCYTVPMAKFGYTEVKIGFVPALVSVFLLRKIGEMNARKMLLTGSLYSAKEAKEIGIVSEIIDADNIKEVVFDIAQKLAETTSLESIRVTKELIDTVQSLDFGAGMNMAAKTNATMRENIDCKKGIQAFLNKEKLNWL